MNIRNKLIALGSIAIIGMASLVGLMTYSSARVNEAETAHRLALSLRTDMLTLRRNEKDFLARKEMKYQKQFDENFTRMMTNMNRMIGFADSLSLDKSPMESLQQVTGDYQSKFNQLVAIQQTIGLNAEDGLYGGLRSAVKNAESLIESLNDDNLMAQMLMLRRNEKDFMLRKDMKYLEKFNKNFDILSTTIAQGDYTPGQAQALKTQFESYHKQFIELVHSEQKMGLDSKSGQLGKLRNTIHQSENELEKLEQSIESTIEALETRLHQIMQAISALVCILVIALSLWLGRSILLPIRQLGDVMSKVKTDRDLTIRAECSRKDEIAQMACHFNDMMIEFQSIIREMSDSSFQLASAAEEVSNITRDTSSHLQNQLSEVDLVATAVNEMEATLIEVAKNTENAYSTAQDANRKAEEGQSVVKESIQSIYQMAENTEKAVQMVHELKANSVEINAVLEVIKHIAEQTNLLALNAAIEAARAGEHGRGFAVVADEVRSLAQRTQQSTTEIEEMIGTLQNKTQDVVSIITVNSSVAENSVERAGSAATSLEEITTASRMILDMSTQIAAATEQQSVVAREINGNIVNIKNVANDSSYASTQNAVASGQVAELAAGMQTSVKKFIY